MSRLISAVLTAVLLALALVGVSFMVVLTPAVTHNLAETHVSTEASGLSREYLVQIADATRAFALGDDAAELPLGSDERLAFTPEVISHLLDVRAVFIAIEVATILLVLLVAALLTMTQQKWGTRALARTLINGGAIPLILALVLIMAGVTDFDALFTAMHGLFFAEGSWTFSYDSLLISALPLPFWMGCAVVLAVTLVILCVSSIVIGLILRRRPQ